MPDYYMWYARYDQDGYMGHRKVMLKAKNMADAEAEGITVLERRSNPRQPYEYIIEEVTARIGPKIHETKT